jgi:hypothetical protein
MLVSQLLCCVCKLAGAMVEADKQQSKKNYYLSYLVMELLGPRVGCMSLDMQAYRHNKPLLVNHGLCMLAVSVLQMLAALHLIVC